MHLEQFVFIRLKLGKVFYFIGFLITRYFIIHATHLHAGLFIEKTPKYYCCRKSMPHRPQTVFECEEISTSEFYTFSHWGGERRGFRTFLKILILWFYFFTDQRFNDIYKNRKKTRLQTTISVLNYDQTQQQWYIIDLKKKKNRTFHEIALLHFSLT